MTLAGSEPSRDPEPQARPTGHGAVPLTDQQLFRVEKLSELGATGPVLGELYVRAVELVEECDSPSGMSLLAHAIRELLNRLPAVLGFSFEDAAPAIAAGLDSDDDTIRHRANDLLSRLGESGVLTLYDEVQALREQP